MRPQLRQSISSGASQTCRISHLRHVQRASFTFHTPSTILARSSRPNGFTQTRCITQQHIRRMAEAEKQWEGWADEIKQGKKQSFLSMLEERGLIQSVVGDRDVLEKLITNKRVGMYAGVDPTAPSLHVGHMLPFMVLGWAYVHGMKSIWLLGGSTSKIGDPTGRTESRQIMKSATRKAYIANMHIQLKKLGQSFERYGSKYGYAWEWAWRRVLENNNVWWNKQSLLDVMTTLGVHARIGPMLGRDTVKTRIEDGSGMSLAEFCYPIMQAWDFWHLYQKGAQIQVGGSDQYGNILFGSDLIKQILKASPNDYGQKPGQDADLMKPMGITTPLLTTSTGEKIGKSAGNAVWLDKDMTSPYELYQYFMRLSDADAERFLKLFTFLPLPRISEIMEEHAKDPAQRKAHHTLASEFVELVHGRVESEKAEKEHRSLFQPNRPEHKEAPPGNKPAALPETGIEGFWNPSTNAKAPSSNLFNMPSPHLTLPRSLVAGQFFHKILWSAGMVSSKQEGFRIIVNNGASVGCMPSSAEQMGDALSYVPLKTWPANVTEKFIIDDSLLILRVGKWKIKIIKVVSDEEFESQGLNAPGWREPESVEERDTDRDLFMKKRRIGSRQVVLPNMVRQEKPKIYSLDMKKSGSAQSKSTSKSDKESKSS